MRSSQKLFRIVPIILLGIVGICPAQSKVPLILPYESIEIVSCTFIKKFETESMRVEVTDEMLDKHRMAIITAKIIKPAGEELKLAAADVTLHYYYGDSESESEGEVAYCAAISTFSSTNESDRALKTTRNAPGWIKQTTGTRTTASSTVYIDLIFKGIEKNVRKMWLCIASPASPPYISNGWRQ
ncbi:hypothetical protein JW777_05720 [bacterium]|nr:hypothetical protein [bacterium]